MTIKIAAICGSARPGNLTSKAMALVLEELATHPDVEITAVHLEDLDLPLPGRAPREPEAIRRLEQAVEDATAVLLASPEYHGGVSSPMKLAIDNLGFPSRLAGKPVALLGVAAGAIGAIKSLEQLRGICAHVGALVLPEAISVARVHEVFDEQGACVDEVVASQIRGVGLTLVDYVRSAVCPNVSQESAVSEPGADPQRPPLRSTHATFREARAEFERAWDDPGHTRIEPKAVDVNRLLQGSFAIGAGVRLTGELLWKAEMEKAWDPATYIPGVVLDGASWGKTTLAGGEPWFVRSSRQKAWKEGTEPGVVLEEVYLDPDGRSVLFFGRSELVGPNGERVEAGTHQPLFHVEHAVAGTEQEPLNRWRIVHLTSTEDPALVERQLGAGSDDWLVGFLRRFVEAELGTDLTPLPTEQRLVQL